MTVQHTEGEKDRRILDKLLSLILIVSVTGCNCVTFAGSNLGSIIFTHYARANKIQAETPVSSGSD